MIRTTLTALVFFLSASTAYAERPRWEDVREMPTEEQLAAAEILERPPWVAMPDARDFAAVYPTAARRTTGGVSRGGDSGLAGRVRLDCIVQPDHYLACRPTITEDNQAFVRPALIVATKFRVAEATEDGAPTAGRRINRTIRFMAQQ